MKIWHDNSGHGNKASWFLKHIIIHDLQTTQKYFFPCQQWLAVEKSDGKIERELFVALESQKTSIKYLMKKEAVDFLRENHLWLSVFNRLIQSSFTRLDRVTCCFVFHYLSMLFNILFYDQTTLKSDTLINLGVINISYTQVKIYFINKPSVKTCFLLFFKSDFSWNCYRFDHISPAYFANNTL